MQSFEDAEYRLKVAEGFLNEANEAYKIKILSFCG